MWADSLQLLERVHLAELATWGGFSVLIGTALVLALRLRRTEAPIIAHMALQCALWGAIELAWALAARPHVPLRDYGSALHLVQRLWIIIELEAAGAVVGLTLAWGGWTLGRRLALAGAGIGIAVQCAALLVLDLMLVRGIHL